MYASICVCRQYDNIVLTRGFTFYLKLGMIAYIGSDIESKSNKIEDLQCYASQTWGAMGSFWVYYNRWDYTYLDHKSCESPL